MLTLSSPLLGADALSGNTYACVLTGAGTPGRTTLCLTPSTEVCDKNVRCIDLSIIARYAAQHSKLGYLCTNSGAPCCKHAD